MVSRMSIYAEERIKILFIAQCGYKKVIETELGQKFTVDGLSSCYSSSFWKPIGIPLSCEYNDYGEGENYTNKLECDFTLKVIRELHLPLKMGENDCHDIPTDGIETIKNATRLAHESQLYYKDCEGRIKPIRFVMIKQTVWDALISGTYDTWRGEKLTIDVITQATQLNINKLIELESNHIELRCDYDSHCKLESGDIPNKKHMDFIRSVARDVKTISGETIEKLGLYNDLDLSSTQLIQLKKEMAEFSFVNLLLTNLRISYSPTTGSGGQDDDCDVYPTVFRKFAEISEKDSHRFDDI